MADGCYLKQEGLAVASIARDDPSTLPGDDPFPRAHCTTDSSVLAPACTATAMRGKFGSEFETKISYNAPMHFRHRLSVTTDRRTDRRTLTRSISARCRPLYITFRSKKDKLLYLSNGSTDFTEIMHADALAIQTLNAVQKNQFLKIQDGGRRPF